MFEENEKKVIALIQGDIPVVENPYRVLAEKAGISEEKFIAILKKLKDNGIIRRYGATLRHQKSGYTSNAMVAWSVPESRIKEVGEKMASFPFVSHCYRRSPVKSWPFNLYTMVHAKSREDCIEKVKSMSKESLIDSFDMLFSTKELKKISMTYFKDEI